jgi:hypothetical protein
MIPKEISGWIFPELASPEDEVPKINLPCGGITLKFIVSRDEEHETDEVLTWDEFRSWDVSIEELSEIAGINAHSYNTWEAVEEYVYENSDNCWQSLVMAPGTHAEHNEVPGRHLVYIVDERTAILTGDRCERGLERIRSAMKTGLAHAPMVLNSDWRTWSPFVLDRRPN